MIKSVATILAGLLALSPATADPGPAPKPAPATDYRARLPQDEVIYFVLPDRFENADPANDRGGLTGGGSYTKTEIVPTPGGRAEDIPGYSRWVANGTAYFEKWGLNMRGSVRYRSTFVGELSGFAANRVRRRALDELIVDAQIGYDFSGGMFNGLSVYVQGQNLTDEPFVTLNGGVRNQVIDYQKYGRRYLAGFSYKF